MINKIFNKYYFQKNAFLSTFESQKCNSNQTNRSGMQMQTTYYLFGQILAESYETWGKFNQYNTINDFNKKNYNSNFSNRDIIIEHYFDNKKCQDGVIGNYFNSVNTAYYGVPNNYIKFN